MLPLIRTYRLFWFYSLSLLLGMTAITSVYGRGDCACRPTVLPVITENAVVSSCCQRMPKTAHRATASCEQSPTATDTQLQSCCCDTLPRWFALQQENPRSFWKAMGITIPLAGLPPAMPPFVKTPIVAVPTWITALSPPLTYQSPLLYQDLPVFVQAFLL